MFPHMIVGKIEQEKCKEAFKSIHPDVILDFFKKKVSVHRKKFLEEE